MSKELDALKRINQKFVQKEWNNKPRETEKDFELIENALKRLENYEKNEDFSKDVINYAFLSEKDKIKKLKALEIIKKRECLFKGLSEVTQEEYELLKEILL